MSKMFKLQMMGSDISLQKDTPEVPDDGKYHLLQGEKVIKSFKIKGQAIKAFKQLLADVGYKPPESNDNVDVAEALRTEKEQLEFYASEMYWSKSHKYGGGGKLSNR